MSRRRGGGAHGSSAGKVPTRTQQAEQKSCMLPERASHAAARLRGTNLWQKHVHTRKALFRMIAEGSVPAVPVTNLYSRVTPSRSLNNT